MLLKVVKNPISRHIPAGARCYGEFALALMIISSMFGFVLQAFPTRGPCTALPTWSPSYLTRVLSSSFSERWPPEASLPRTIHTYDLSSPALSRRPLLPNSMLPHEHRPFLLPFTNTVASFADARVGVDLRIPPQWCCCREPRARRDRKPLGHSLITAMLQRALTVGRVA